MERSNSPHRSKEVVGPPTAQRHRAGDQAFMGKGRQMRTGGISMGSLWYRYSPQQALVGA
jgi:hypothetical protein